MFKSILNYLGAGVINQVSTFLFWIIVAKIVKPEELGEAYEYLLYVDMAVVFSIFGADSVIYKYYFSNRRKEEVLSVSLLLSIIGYFIFLVISISAYFFNYLQFNYYFLFFLVIQVFLNVSVNLIYADLIAQKNSKKYLELNIVRYSSFLILGSIFFYYSNNKYALQYTYISSLFLIFYFNRKVIYSNFKGNCTELKVFLTYAFPFMLYGFAGIINSYLSRLLVLNILNARNFSIFAFFYIFYTLVDSFLSNLNKSWTPYVFSKLKINSTNIIEIVLLASSVLIALYSLLLFGFILLVDSSLIHYFLQDIYIENINTLYAILLAPIFLIYFMSINPFITFEINSKKMFCVNTLKMISALVCSYYLILKFSLFGASMSVIVTSLIQLFVFLFFYRKTIKISRIFLFYIFYSIIAVMFNFLLLGSSLSSLNLFRFSILLHVIPAIILFLKHSTRKSSFYENLDI